MTVQTNPLAELKTERVPSSSVSPNSYNPNWEDDHEFTLLIRSMEADGFTQPIILQSSTREIVDGEHRWTAWTVLNFLRQHWPGEGVHWPVDLIMEVRRKRLEVLAGGLVRIDTVGYEGEYAGVNPLIDIIPVEFTEAQMKMATLRHNRARGDEDFQLLAALLLELQQAGAAEMAKEALQMGQDELENILASVSGEALDSPAAFEEFVASAPERAVAGAAEEKATQAVEQTTYRVSLIFAGEEADLVKGVLGPRPAERIVQICREEVASP